MRLETAAMNGTRRGGGHNGAAVQLTGLATALPPYGYDQDQIKAFAADMFGADSRDFVMLQAAFENAGIDRRHAVRPLDWYRQPLGWRERNVAFTEAAQDLLVDAGRRALTQAGIAGDTIDTVVTISSTGLATPTLEARVAPALGLRADVQRVPVFGLGCAGGVTGLALAARLARAAPGTHVLLLCVETCTLAFRADRGQRADIIASILFGDGAAAACLAPATADAPGPLIGDGREWTWPDSLNIMGWDIDDSGFGVVFDRSIPDFIDRHFTAGLDRVLVGLQLRRGDFARLAFHPGGAKVISALESALDLANGTLDHERAVLRSCGNMSAPTALFVLQRLLAAGQRGRVLLGALGPGFTVSLLPLDCR